ncbi:unnamed protein product [Onchocerca flexuosa]|uniref:Secreted protein n=1 Tax=Onchocerca flexuosa TaxID=387005 RepID=A0A183HDE2_9BILA|nr:unnamed protein product [Onchocerca flexuosa]
MDSGLHTYNCHVAAFIHVFTNVFDRFNGATVLHVYVRFVIFDSKGEYGTTHRLSTSMSPFQICIVANLPPSSADLLLYKGYPPFPVTMLDTNARGYCLDHFFVYRAW